MKRSGSSKSLVVALFLFTFSAGCMIYDALGLNFGVLNAFFQLLSDSSMFLTILCIIIILYNLALKRKNYLTIFLYFLDIILVNQLYLNDKLSAFSENVRTFFLELEWQAVVFYAFVIIIVFICIYIERKNHHDLPSDEYPTPNSGGNSDFEDISYSETKKDGEVKTQSADVIVQRNISTNDGNLNQKVTNMTDKDTENVDSIEIPTLNSGSDQKFMQKQDSKLKDKQSEWPSKRMQSFAIGLGIICTGIIATYLARNKVLELFEWESTLSQNVEWFFGILPPLVLISVGIIVSLLLLAIISSVKKRLASDEIRGTAYIAAILEILIFIWIISGGGNLDDEFFDRLIDFITSNALVALVLVPIILFVILDIAISIICGLFFSQKHALPKWYNEAKEKFREIEEGIVKFALNLILGFVKFLLFIPDFLNQISGVLLDETDFFPKESPSEKPTDDKEG